MLPRPPLAPELLSAKALSGCQEQSTPVKPKLAYGILRGLSSIQGVQQCVFVQKCEFFNTASLTLCHPP